MEWIKEFDRDWAYLNGELPKHSGRTEEIKAFITTQITKARNNALEEAAKEIEGGKIKGEPELNSHIDRQTSDIRDLKTKET